MLAMLTEINWNLMKYSFEKVLKRSDNLDIISSRRWQNVGSRLSGMTISAHRLCALAQVPRFLAGSLMGKVSKHCWQRYPAELEVEGSYIHATNNLLPQVCMRAAQIDMYALRRKFARYSVTYIHGREKKGSPVSRRSEESTL